MSLTNDEILNSPIMTEQFRELMGITEKNGKIYFNDINGKTMVFNYSNGSSAFELLGSNLLAYTLFKGDSRGQFDYWETEYQISNENKNRNRSDFIAKGANGKVSAIWENKYLDSSVTQKDTFEKQISKAKKQVFEKYINELKKRDEINEEIFLTIAVVDTVKMIKNPEKIVKYKNSSRDEKNESYNLFQKTGIYIETFKVNTNNLEFSYPYIDFIDPQNNRHQPPQIIKFYSKIDKNAAFSDKRNVIKVSDAVKLHTCTLTRHGIANIRDIIGRLNKDKKELTKNIFATAFRQFLKKESDEETWAISKHTQPKSFVVIEEETFFTEEDLKFNSRIDVFLNDKNKNIDEKSKFIKNELDKNIVERRVLSTNSALVDGQNSLDSLHVILEFLTSNNINNPDFKEIKKDFLDIIKNISREENVSFDIIQKRDEFKKYIQDAEIHIEISTATNIEEARRMARNKNFSNQVKKGDLHLAQNKDACIEINSNLYEVYGIFAQFPKVELDDFLKENASMTEYNIDIKKLAKILYALDGVHKNLKDENKKLQKIKQLLNLSDAIGSDTITEEHVKFLQKNFTYIKKLNLEGKITEEQINRLTMYQDEREIVVKAISENKENIEIRKSLNKDIKGEQERLKKNEDRLNELNEEISSIYDVSYVGQNINKAAIAATIYKKVEASLKKDGIKRSLEARIKEMSSENARNNLKVEKIVDFAFGFIILNIKSEITNNDEIDLEDFFEDVTDRTSLNELMANLNLEEMSIKFSERFLYLLDFYSLSMSDLRYKQTRQENGKIIRDLETGKTTDDIREEMFGEFDNISILNSNLDYQPIKGFN